MIRKIKFNVLILFLPIFSAAINFDSQRIGNTPTYNILRPRYDNEVTLKIIKTFSDFVDTVMQSELTKKYDFSQLKEDIKSLNENFRGKDFAHHLYFYNNVDFFEKINYSMVNFFVPEFLIYRLFYIDIKIMYDKELRDKSFEFEIMSFPTKTEIFIFKKTLIDAYYLGIYKNNIYETASGQNIKTRKIYITDVLRTKVELKNDHNSHFWYIRKHEWPESSCLDNEIKKYSKILEIIRKKLIKSNEINLANILFTSIKILSNSKEIEYFRQQCLNMLYLNIKEFVKGELCLECINHIKHKNQKYSEGYCLNKSRLVVICLLNLNKCVVEEIIHFEPQKNFANDIIRKILNLPLDNQSLNDKVKTKFNLKKFFSYEFKNYKFSCINNLDAYSKKIILNAILFDYVECGSFYLIPYFTNIDNSCWIHTAINIILNFSEFEEFFHNVIINKINKYNNYDDILNYFKKIKYIYDLFKMRNNVNSPELCLPLNYHIFANYNRMSLIMDDWLLDGKEYEFNFLNRCYNNGGVPLVLIFRILFEYLLIEMFEEENPGINTFDFDLLRATIKNMSKIIDNLIPTIRFDFAKHKFCDNNFDFIKKIKNTAIYKNFLFSVSEENKYFILYFYISIEKNNITHFINEMIDLQFFIDHNKDEKPTLSVINSNYLIFKNGLSFMDKTFIGEEKSTTFRGIWIPKEIIINKKKYVPFGYNSAYITTLPGQGHCSFIQFKRGGKEIIVYSNYNINVINSNKSIFSDNEAIKKLYDTYGGPSEFIYASV